MKSESIVIEELNKTIKFLKHIVEEGRKKGLTRDEALKEYLDNLPKEFWDDEEEIQ